MGDFASQVAGATRKKFNDAPEQGSAEAAAAAAFGGSEQSAEQTAPEAQAATQLNDLINQATGQSAEEQEVAPVQSEEPAQTPVEPDRAAVASANMEAVFATVGVDKETLASFAREYSKLSTPVTCVADTKMLLEYMVSKERSTGVTASFHACGVDTVAFEQAAAETEGTGVVPINVQGKEEPALYEKIKVDGEYYLSCLSECLNADYLYQVISEATEALYVQGVYTYTLIGPRPIANHGGFINTLKLNSYELSVLLAFVDSMGGVTTKHCIEDGRATIKFHREQ